MQRLLLVIACLIPAIVLATTTANSPHNSSSAVQLLNSDSHGLALVFDSQSLHAERTSDSNEAVPHDGGEPYRTLLHEQLCIADEGSLCIPGHPILPAISRFVVIPPNQAVELVIQEGEVRHQAAEFSPAIFNEETPDSPPSVGATLVAQAFAQRGDHGLFPPVVAEISDPVVIRGVRLVRVTTYPVQFDSASNCYLIRDHIQADIRFINAAPTNPVTTPVRRQRSKAFLNFIRGMAINGDVVGRDDPDYDADPAYIGHYLVVCHESILRYAVPFIEWRRREGYEMDILSVPSNRSGDQNWIKQQIQAVYDGALHQGIDPFDLLMIIGDHQGLYAGANYTIATPSYGWDYACLEGNDDDADVGLAQWIAGDESEMNLFSGRTLSYEMTPYFNDTRWFQKGAVFAQKWAGNWHISLHTNVQWGAEVMKAHNISDVRVYNNFNDQDQSGQQVTSFIMDQVNEGVNLLFGRAQASYLHAIWRGDVSPTGIFPIYVNYAGHQEAITWEIMRDWNGQDLVGPVVGTNIYGVPQTISNSMLWLETVSGLMERELPFGWARVAAVMAPEIYIPNFASNATNKAATASYGDPGLQPWLGVPREVHAEYPEDITPCTHRIEVRVLNAHNEAVSGAQVTLYFPGNMPAAERVEYATYNDMFMQTRISDSDGYARFIFDNDVEFVTGTRMYVTVSGRDIKPFLGDRVIRDLDAGIELSGYSLSQVNGNGDDIINPGEQFTLSISARNPGDSDALADVCARVVSNSPNLEVAGDEITFGDIGAGETVEGNQSVDVTFSPSCPDGASRPATRPTALIEFSSGELVWQSAIKFDPCAPHLKVTQVPGGNMIPDTTATIDVEITNLGSLPVGVLSATLRSLGMGVFVIRGASSYDGVDIGHTARLSGQRFIVTGNKVVVPGSLTPMQLILTDENGFCDTASFDLKIGTPRAGAPQGPDKYGYVCYDDTDTGWEIAPTYEWIEIDPRTQDYDLEGTRIGFRGQSPSNIGEAIAVELPFDFQFYGHTYDHITVATNGFITIGDQHDVTNFQNWPMDRAMGGGAGMLSPLWDALAMGQNGQVYYVYRHDDDHDEFIIEWSRMRHENDNTDLTFEAILYGPTVRVTASGDADILFQYRCIANVAGDEWAYDVPYASVGISSPSGDTGINYSFNNVYPVTSASLQNRRAILFTTSSLNLNAVLYGFVTDHWTGQPVEAALIRTKHGFSALTDADGYWRIPNAPSGVNFDIVCGKQGYNDSAYTGFEVAEFDSLEINFDLLHPEFTVSSQHLAAALDSGDVIQIPFALTNTGNGMLEWSEEKRLLGEANTPRWQLRHCYAVGDTTNCNKIQGVAFTGEQFYVCGYLSQDSARRIFVLDRNGSLIRSFPQAGHGQYGIKDLEWDGALLWGPGGQGDDNIYGFTTTGDVVYSWRGPWSPTTNIAWDSNRNVLWLSGTTTDHIVPYDINGNAVGDPLSRKGLRMYGLAYMPDDPDGYGLYINASLSGVLSMVYKMNTETGDTMLVTNLNLNDGSTGLLGASITNTYDVYSWVLMSIDNVAPQFGNDLLKVFQIDARKDWFNLDVESGVLPPEARQNFVLTLNTADLPDTLFEGELHFSHNADDGLEDVFVSLRVRGPLPPPPFALLEPADGDTVTALPLMGDSLRLPEVHFIWQSSNDPNAGEQVEYRFYLKAGNDSIRVSTSDTTLSLGLDTLRLPFVLGSPVEWCVEARSGEDVVPCQSPFHFTLVMNSRDIDVNLPVEFGFQSLFPNPFNSILTVHYGIEHNGPANIRLYDLAGRLQGVLFDGTAKIGLHQIALNGQALASGVYFLRLESCGEIEVSKIALMR